MLAWIIRYAREWHNEDIKIRSDMTCSKCKKESQLCSVFTYCPKKHAYCCSCDGVRDDCAFCKYLDKCGNFRDDERCYVMFS
jgi:hypothetical protein